MGLSWRNGKPGSERDEARYRRCSEGGKERGKKEVKQGKEEAAIDAQEFFGLYRR